MIKLENITKKYQDKLVFKDLSLSFKENAINIVHGASGCGKTTLFNIISGIDKDYSGNVIGIPEDVAYLFQEDRLLPYYSVLENVLFTIPEEIETCQRVNIAKKNLIDMELLYDQDAFPHELSGGMSRRVAIARVLSYPSSLMLLDEPFNGLNIELKKTVITAVKEIMLKKNKTVIIITHDISPFDQTEELNLIEIDK